MFQSPAGPFVTELLIGYMTLFSIINPFGIAFVFYDRTRPLAEATRNKIARTIARYSFIIIVVSWSIGGEVLSFFGISVSALRIAGGMVVALSGWSMLSAPDDTATSDTANSDIRQIEGMAFFPLTIPLTTGPGSIAAAIALGAGHDNSLRTILHTTIVALVIAALVALTIYIAYSRASTFSRWAGLEGTRVITRLSAFLLMCIGVQLFLTGFSDVLPNLIAQGIARR